MFPSKINPRILAATGVVSRALQATCEKARGEGIGPGETFPHWSEVVEALNALANQVPEWQPPETAPKDVEFIAWAKSVWSDEPRRWLACWCRDRFSDTTEGSTLELIAWQPAPAPPQDIKR